MRVQDASRIRACSMHGAVNRESGRVHRVRSIENDLAIQVDLDETARGHFLEEQTVGVDQKMLVRTRHPRRYVRKYQVIPAMHGDQPIAGRQVLADLPLLFRHLRFDRQRFSGCAH